MNESHRDAIQEVKDRMKSEGQAAHICRYPCVWCFKLLVLLQLALKMAFTNGKETGIEVPHFHVTLGSSQRVTLAFPSFSFRQQNAGGKSSAEKNTGGMAPKNPQSHRFCNLVL